MCASSKTFLRIGYKCDTILTLTGRMPYISSVPMRSPTSFDSSHIVIFMVNAIPEETHPYSLPHGLVMNTPSIILYKLEILHWQEISSATQFCISFALLIISSPKFSLFPFSSIKSRGETPLHLICRERQLLAFENFLPHGQF